MGDVSEHFSRHEFDCHDGTHVPADMMPGLSLLAWGVLEPIREAVGCPVIVLSGYRTPAYNASIPGSAPDSRHTHGDAADIWCPTFDTGGTKLWALIRQMWDEGKLPDLGGLGRYDNRVHVDARPHVPGALAEWDFRTRK